MMLKNFLKVAPTYKKLNIDKIIKFLFSFYKTRLRNKIESFLPKVLMI